MPRPIRIADPQTRATITKALEEALANGASLDAACHAAGIGHSAHYHYIERAKQQEERGEEGTPEREYAEAAARGRRRAEQAALRVVQGAATGWVERRIETIERDDGRQETRTIETERRDWRAAAWWLERALPKRWGQHATVEHQHRVKTWNVPGLVLPGISDAPPELPPHEDGASDGRGLPTPDTAGEGRAPQGASDPSDAAAAASDPPVGPPRTDPPLLPPGASVSPPLLEPISAVPFEEESVESDAVDP
jgi:hypothetical protein